MPSNRTWLILAVLAWLGLLAIPFVLSPKRPPTPERTLTIITPHGPEILDEFLSAFERKMAAEGRPVHVERVIVGGTGETVRRVENDYKSITRELPLPDGADPKAPHPRELVRPGLIDLMWGGGTDPYISLGKTGALEPYKPSPEIDKAIPAETAGVVIKPKNQLYIGTAFAGFGIVANKKLCREKNLPVPGDWTDLADPRFFDSAGGVGRLGNADIRFTGAIKQCYEAVLQSQGWEQGWTTLTCIAGNSAQFYPNSSATPEAVGMGNVVAGFSYDRPAMAEIDHRGADTISFVLPPLTIINPDAIAILKGAPEPELAREFIEFVLSHEGQSLWYLKQGLPGGPRQYALRRMPIRPDVFEGHGVEDWAITINPFTYSFKRPDGTPFVFDDKLAGKRRRTLPDLAGAGLVDTHVELRAAWARIVKDGCRPEAVQAFAEMPVKDTDLPAIEETWNKVPSQREKTLAEWKDFFRAKYNRIAAEGQ